MSGKSGRGAVSGFNSKNRVRMQKAEYSVNDKGKKTKKLRDAKPGDVFQIAVLGINSPLGNPPGNKIFLHGNGATNPAFGPWAMIVMACGEVVPLLSRAARSASVARAAAISCPRSSTFVEAMTSFRITWLSLSKIQTPMLSRSIWLGAGHA